MAGNSYSRMPVYTGNQPIPVTGVCSDTFMFVQQKQRLPVVYSATILSLVRVSGGERVIQRDEQSEHDQHAQILDCVFILAQLLFLILYNLIQNSWQGYHALSKEIASSGPIPSRSHYLDKSSMVKFEPGVSCSEIKRSNHLTARQSKVIKHRHISI